MQGQSPLNDTWVTNIKNYINSSEAQRKITQITQDLTSPLFIIDLDYLRRDDPELCSYFLNEPTSALATLEKILAEFISGIVRNPTPIIERLRISATGNFGAHNLTPRTLKSKLLCKLVKVQGVAISLSSVRSRLVESVHYCMNTQKFLAQEFSDQLGLRSTDLRGRRGFLPLTDSNDNPLSLEFGLSHYKDVQTIQIQEIPENIPSGLLSRSVEVILQEELVDKIKPGDRVEVIGVLRAHIGASGIFSGLFSLIVQAFDISTILDKADATPTPVELKEIKIVAKRPDLVELLRRSFAPSLYGLEGPKEAALLLLVGGDEKVLPGGLRLRGDINVLLVGDPSTAKSQLLRRTMAMSSNAFSATGRGSTGVGLTAAIVVDRDSKERKLEAGAMVLADRGLLCVDEFDKMAESDRIAMHEAMEQQTVSLAKAGVQVCLNARCTIFAAANPTYGNYIASLSHARNIGLPETLLSRFDLIFVILDFKNTENDRDVARRVTTNHRIYNHGYDYSDPLYSRQDFFAPGGYEKLPLLTTTFLRKYISYVKQREAPVLSDEATAFLRENWILLRQFDCEVNLKNRISHIIPVTIRSLESLIRLSTAYAKLRLSPAVGQIDCARAINLFLGAFYGGFENQRVVDRFSHILSLCQDNNGGLKKRKGSRKSRELYTHTRTDVLDIHTPTGEGALWRSNAGQAVEYEDREREIYKKVFKALIDATQQRKSTSISITEFIAYIEANKSKGKKYGFSLRDPQHLDKILQSFAQKNQVLVSDGFIYKI